MAGFPSVGGTRIEIPSTSGALRAYLALPDAGTGAGVVVLAGSAGLNGDVDAIADALAETGFVAVAPTELPAETPDREPAVAATLLATAEETLRRSSRAGIGVVGFARGGSRALHLAALDPTVRAAVVYYAAPPDDEDWAPARVHGAVLGHFSDHERFSPAHLGRELRAAGVPVEFHIYPGTRDGFVDDGAAAYDAAAAELSWQRTVAFLRQHLLVDGT